MVGGASDDRAGDPLGPVGGEGSTGKIPAGDGSSQTGAGSQGVAPGVNDNGRLGINSRLYLSAEVPKLVVEVDAVRGAEPTPASLSTLRSRLAGVADKPRGIEMLPVETFSSDSAPWTEADLVQAEKQNRDRFSTRNEIVLYVQYVDGTFEENAEALGVAYKSSAYAVFAEHIREVASTPLVPSTAIESAVNVHEMGHVLALVNIGYSSPRDHEDPQHDRHSSNPDSVMYWAIDNVGVAGLLGGRTSPPTDFDQDDKADLADIRSGRLRVE